MMALTLREKRAAKDKAAAQPDASAANTDTQAEPKEPSGTFFAMYGSSQEGQRETVIDPAPSRPQHVTRPHAATYTADDGVRYNALGLRAGVFEPSTHRPAPTREAVATARERQERRAWEGFERMLNLFNRK
jgi:hypothetical protein